ncbi:MAG TPA: hypothetical protein PLB86_07250 [Dermatophilaceae bacterium]|nr:hypothetical protein [Dermatophilaceae bacterium]
MRKETVVRIPETLVAAVQALTYTVENTAERFAAEMEGTRNAVRISGCEARAIVDGAGVGLRVTTSPGRLAGWSVRETSGAAPAIVRFLDGPGGDGVAEIALPAGQGSTLWLLPGGVSLTYGLSVQVVQGAVSGAVYVAGGG